MLRDNVEKSLADGDAPKILGHRGSSAFAPENTMIAFKQSFEDGADGIEFDVCLSSDKVPVVIHDSNLKRTAGRKEFVKNLTSKELSEIEVGSWFNRRFPAKAKEEFSSARIPLLSEVFNEFKGKDFQLYVEMKLDKGDDYVALAKAVANSIREHEINNQVVVESFDLSAIKEIKRLAPEIHTAALFEPKILRLIRTKRRLIDEAISHQADEIALHYTLATRHTVKAATQEGLKTVIWTADNPVWIKRAMDYGIKAIITNNPPLMIANCRLPIAD